MKTSALTGTGVLLSESRPLRVSAERVPDLSPMGAVAIRQHPDQGVGIIEVLPDGDDLGAVVLEDFDLFLAEALMQLVDGTIVIAATVARRIGRVHANLEAPRIGRYVS